MLAVLKSYEIIPEEVSCCRDVVKVKSGKKSYALKITTVHPARLRFTLSAMEYLWSRGFWKMSRLVKKPDGSLFEEWDHGAAFLTEWVDGRHADFFQPRELAGALKMLAEMHRAGDGFCPPENSSPRNDIGRWKEKWVHRIKDLEKMLDLAAQGQNDFDTHFRMLAPRALEDAHAAVGSLDASGYEDYVRELLHIKPLCHRDFVYHNIIFQRPHYFLIDFEYCVQDSRLTDIARIIRSLGKHHSWDLSFIKNIVCCYHNAYPFSKTEQKLLSVRLSFPHEVWRIGHRWYFSRQRNERLSRSLHQEILIREQKLRTVANLTECFPL